MSDLKMFADDALGRIVETLLRAGFFSCDEAKTRETFDRVRLVVWQAIHDAMNRQRDQLIEEFAAILIRDRAARFRIFAEPSRS